MSGQRLSSAARGYGPEWRRESRAWLKRHPWCEYHLGLGRQVRATIVDHRVPHRGKSWLFWDRANWQALCKGCHDAAKQREERAGRVIGCDERGIPRDPHHHWRTGGA